MLGSASILGTRVDAGTYELAVSQVIRWAGEPAPRLVCVANVHVVMEAYNSSEFKEIVNGADMVTSDGMPLVWMLRRLGLKTAERVYGPDLMLQLCEAAARHRVPVGFYGGTTDVLAALGEKLTDRFNGLEIAYAYAPPFRPLTPEEDESVTKAIVASGARILFVGLGCPKQEKWMASHKDSLPLVQLGVGAAFPFHAGLVRQAPRWMQDRGLEWLFRLAVEPKRLWRRYLYHNPRFVVLAGSQLMRRSHYDAEESR